ncbi:TPA: Bro-N domain-containing protein [Clostridioides difficile]|uniref:BRO-N domain-containing protein n=1 Tax=Clostridioides difficile TaxID=1496 RepID=UPI0003B2A4AB|nr:BRO family protein [Clostridioides difficile]MDC9313260.1 BRO family protein [Clostridioides difficile]MDE3696477.1 BRO family protein [Clostridioides difficile]MDL0222560.1 BRO family protein [Clostridioides difficile]MDL0383036.1 BRO family protein [Clostridioides difficile]MDV9801681.1 BRO family protein [Clostridioides difficile]
MNNLMVFEGKEVEIFELDGKILFNPRDVAECLEIKNVNDNISKMNEKQVIKLTNSKVGDSDFRKLHNRGENFLTESGVYKLIFASKKKKAEKFQDWVTEEVLPNIRKHGSFSINTNNIKDVLMPVMLNGMLAGFEQLSIENDKKIDNRFNQIENKLDMKYERQDRQFQEMKDMVGLKTKNIRTLSTLLKIRLSELKGYNVNAYNYDYRTVVTRLFSIYNVEKWEDIPIAKFNEIHAMIDGIESMEDIYTWNN